MHDRVAPGAAPPLHLPVVQALLQGGADVDKAAGDGRTPLHMTSEKGHVSVVQALLQHWGEVGDKYTMVCILLATTTTVSTILYDYSPAAASGLVKMPDCSL